MNQDNEYSRAFVINDDENISDDPNKIILILKAIFRVKELDTKYNFLLDFILENKANIKNDKDVKDYLKSYLFEKISSDNKKDFYVEILYKVMKHEIDTSENRQAYVSSTKENPHAVFWPNENLFDELPIAKENKLIDYKTPIGSAGSCFAMEIAFKLQQEGFNYIITEDNLYLQNNYHMACARWGIIFNVPSMRQLVEKAFGVRKLPKLLWSHQENGKTIYRDPFREDILFDSVEEFELDYDRHIKSTREALAKVKVFVMTLGVNEVWTLKSDGSVFSRSPWRFASYLVEKKVMTVEENVNELQKMIDLWKIYNPDIQLILTVSPVPLSATFRANDYHVITANAHSKATLRVAAEIFCNKNENVHYFPSYETVMYSTKNAWQEDKRHVSKESVANVMKVFDHIFVNQDKGYTLFLLSKSKTYINQEKFVLAENLLKKLYSIEPENAEALYNLGYISFKNEDYEKAIDYFSDSLEYGICDYDLCLYLSKSLEKVGELETSELYKQKALELKR